MSAFKMSANVYLIENYYLRLTQSQVCPAEASGKIVLKPEDVFPQDKTAASWKLGNELRSALSDPKQKVEDGCFFVTMIKHYNPDYTLRNSQRLNVTLKSPAAQWLISKFGKKCFIKIKLDKFCKLEMQRYGTIENLLPYNAKAVSPLVSIAMQPRKEEDGNNIIFEDTFATDRSKDWLFSDQWEPNKVYYTLVTISLEIPIESAEKGFKNLETSSWEISELTAFTKRILQDQISTDVILVGSNNKQIGCHKIFLVGNSSVFEAMFNNKQFLEAEKSRVEIKEMSEEGISAMLRYLYHRDLSSAQNNFNIAMELLNASEKYAISTLKLALKFIFHSKDNEWYKGVKALQLFLFARNVEDCLDLKLKSVDVLKINHEELENSEEYINLFRENPMAAMDLCSALLNAQKL